MAVIHEQGGIEAATEVRRRPQSDSAKWEALKTAARVTPKAARVAGFIVFWAVGMRETGMEKFSITEYQRFWNENERQAYRLQKEFRELWPEYETPTRARSPDREVPRRP